MSGRRLSGLKAVWREQAGKRFVIGAAYALSSYLVLRWFYGGDTFCHGRAGALPAVVSLTISIALFDLALSLLAFFAYGESGSTKVERWMLALICGVVMCGVLGFLPGLLYKGYGVFRLEGTEFDVSCLFREGFGIAFPIVVAPAIAALSFTREIIMGRWLERARARTRAMVT
jgi:hypothetical protein